jgi:signal transduction histidine kinase
MGDQPSGKAKPHSYSLRNLSIRQQLQLLICLLLLVLILLFGAISYMGIRSATMAIGQQRLRTLTEQLSGLFQVSANTLATATQSFANKDEITGFFGADPRHPSSNPSTLGAAQGALQRLLADSQTIRAELRDPNGTVLLAAGKDLAGQAGPTGEAGGKRVSPDPAKEITTGKPDSNFVGRIYVAGDSMFYPIIATVNNHGKAEGYLFRWRPVRATSKAVAELSKLMGGKAAMYFGNTDGTLWTDMLKTVPTPPALSKDPHQIVTYNRPGGKVIANAMPIPRSRWVILVELSQELIVEAADRFLYWMLAIGAVLILTGILFAWLISRNFTRPLKRLMHATAAIAGGDYSPPALINRRDEIGRLATAFNSMASQVRHAHEELEDKVKSRTKELEMVNKELEAFSYSVSHDLRAPLRAVSGYAMMLKEDYEDTFDDEAKRITGNILSNVKMMGRLIDDLIAFSRLGKREVRRQVTDMKALADTCVSELNPAWPEERFLLSVDPMPPCKGDEDLLKQVWMNLIGNAMKYSSKSPDPRINIGATQNVKGPVYFVRDNGAGFDMKYADKLFKVFQRLHTQEEFEGTGVGLALVKRILDKHQGEIWAEATPGEGAVFYFRLPA